MTATPDLELKGLLRGFESSLAALEGPLVSVSVQVARRARFTNEAVGVSGHTVVIDEPVVFGGGGKTADPAEHLLAAVGASLSVTLTAHAALRDLTVEAIQIRLSAELDERSFFAPRRWPRAGLLNASVDLAINGPLSEAQASALIAEALRASPVFRSLKRRPRVAWTLNRTD